MLPRRFHYILAHSFLILGCTGAIIGVVCLWKFYQTDGSISLDALGILWAVLSVLIAAVLGFVLAIFPGWMIVGNIVAKVQGAPFQKGDSVCVLKGLHKNKIATVYEIWAQRGQVRVDLGSELKEKVQDVFSHVEICRVKKD